MFNYDIMTFGFLLRKLREREGIGIKKLAPDLKVSYTYLSKLENNKVLPSEDVVGRIAEYFDYNRDSLLLAADKIPDDVLRILKSNPEETIRFLREEYTSIRGSDNAGKLSKNIRKSE